MKAGDGDPFTLMYEGSDLIIVYRDDGAAYSDEKRKYLRRDLKHTGMGLFLIRIYWHYRAFHPGMWNSWNGSTV